MIKGITRPDDARRAVERGAPRSRCPTRRHTSTSTPATIRCLPGVADAVGDQIEVLLDGGIRGQRRGQGPRPGRARGDDRPGLPWGMAAAGERGVTTSSRSCARVSETLLGLGKASVRDLSPDDVIVPDGFALDRKI